MKLSFLGIFNLCGQFPQDFGQAQAQTILYFIEIRRECFIVVRLMVLVFWGIEVVWEECSNFRKMVNSKYF